MKLTRRTAAVTAIGTVVVVAGGGLAVASVPQANGVITGCFSPVTGNLRVTGSGACKTGEKRLDWNVKGATGPRGFTGPPGPSAASSSLLVNGTPTVIDANATLNLSATCPAGKVVLGTGLLNTNDLGGSTSTVTIARQAISADRSSVSYLVRNVTNGSGIVTTVTAQVICG